MSCYEASGPVFTAKLSAVTGSNQTVVAAVAGKKIRVLQLSGCVTAAATVKFHDDTPTDLTGAMPAPLTAAEILGYSPHGWGDTAVGKNLQIDVSASVFNGVLVYQEVT